MLVVRINRVPCRVLCSLLKKYSLAFLMELDRPAGHFSIGSTHESSHLRGVCSMAIEAISNYFDKSLSFTLLPHAFTCFIAGWRPGNWQDHLHPEPFHDIWAQ